MESASGPKARPGKLFPFGNCPPQKTTFDKKYLPLRTKKVECEETRGFRLRRLDVVETG